MSIQRTRVYVAGLLTPRGVWSANLAVDYLENVRRMITFAKTLLLDGYDPFVPSMDFGFWLVDDRRVTEAMIKRFSKSWLLACDAVFLTEGWRKSPGSIAEKELAEREGIPVFTNKDVMDEYFGKSE